MYISEELKLRHDKKLADIVTGIINGGVPPKIEKVCRAFLALGDLYAYFMRYDWAKEPIILNNRDIVPSRSGKSEKDNWFETVLVPRFKKQKKETEELFNVYGIELLEQGLLTKPINGSSVGLISGQFGGRQTDRIHDVYSRENTYIIHNPAIDLSRGKIAVKVSTKHRGRVEKAGTDSIIHIFNCMNKGEYTYIGEYKIIEFEKIDNKEIRVVLLPKLLMRSISVPIPDFKDVEQLTRTNKFYYRDPLLRDESIKRAKGKCENPHCKNPVPFINKQGEVFLESHHIEFLSEDGGDRLDNLISLCPNCHSESHHASLSRMEELSMLFKSTIIQKYYH